MRKSSKGIPKTELYFVSDISHFLAGCLAVLGPIALGLDHPWICAGIIISFAAVKEGYWDPRHETKIVAGSAIRDFSLYAAGAVVGLALHFCFPLGGNYETNTDPDDSVPNSLVYCVHTVQKGWVCSRVIGGDQPPASDSWRPSVHEPHSNPDRHQNCRR